MKGAFARPANEFNFASRLLRNSRNRAIVNYKRARAIVSIFRDTNDFARITYMYPILVASYQMRS